MVAVDSNVAADRIACTTLVTTPGYIVGAQVLAHSIRKSGWPHGLMVMVTPNISDADREELLRVWDTVVEVEHIDNPNTREQQALHNFATTYTKLRVWEQANYSKLVFIDADAVVLGDLSELVQRPAFAAAPCTTAPDCFNTGVLVVEPSQEVFDDMMESRRAKRSYDGSDQGFLNAYFSDWFTGCASRRLPLTYNVPWFLSFYGAGWDRAHSDIRILHYCGPQKPWSRRAGWQMRCLFRIIRTLTSLRLADPIPQDHWTEIHRDFLTGTGTQA